jgi:hypothetical protein
MPKKNVPDHPGMFFCKTGTCKWFNTIAVVKGEHPFLRVIFHDSTDLSIKLNTEVSDVTEWGPELERPAE